VVTGRQHALGEIDVDGWHGGSLVMMVVIGRLTMMSVIVKAET
jgi:hypothetical protein